MTKDESKLYKTYTNPLHISSTLKTPELFQMTEKIIFGLLKEGINVISYSCDGTETEHGVLRLFRTVASSTRTLRFRHPYNGFPDLTFDIPLLDGHPVVPREDSLHALKTARNNLFTGARLLVLFGHTATYGMIRPLALDGGPLYPRDVDNLDRQDDRAALRLMSADALEALVRADRKAIKKGEPRLCGVIVYLFVFGELVDAYQNRFIPSTEHLRMAFRALFFLEIWKSTLR